MWSNNPDSSCGHLKTRLKNRPSVRRSIGPSYTNSTSAILLRQITPSMTKNYAISRHGATVVAVKDAGTVISSVRPWGISNRLPSYAHRKRGKRVRREEPQNSQVKSIQERTRELGDMDHQKGGEDSEMGRWSGYEVWRRGIFVWDLMSDCNSTGELCMRRR